MLSESLVKEILTCHSCKLRDSCRSPVVGELVGVGIPTIMLVGEAPGEVEDREGRPFHPTAPAGSILRALAAQVGIDCYWLTNANKCRPPGNRTPNPIERDACYPLLLKEIEEINPKVIGVVGLSAAARWFGNRTMAVINGDARAVRMKGSDVVRVVVPIQHPASYFHQGRDARVLETIKIGLERVLLEAGRE